MTVTIKAANAAGFLGLVPSMLGYTPSESTIIVLFKGSRTLGCMRIDVPAPGMDLNEYASTLAGLACKKEDADGVAVIVYTERRHDEQALAVLNSMLVRLNDCGMRIVDMLYVAGDGWGSLVEGAEPRPLVQIITDPEAPPVQAGDQRAGTKLPTINETYAKDVQARIRKGPDLEALSGDMLNLIERVSTEARPLPKDAAALAYIIERPSLRDIAIIQWCRDSAEGERALDAQLAWEEGVEYPQELAMALWGEGSQPDPARLERVAVNLRELAAITSAPGVFATLAWISWALGRSTEADHFAVQALKQDDAHGLAEIVRSFVNAGHLPAWAFAPKSNA